MSADPDHEVIDSPEALLHHLFEAHGVQEAAGVDAATAPVHFWLRRHAELDRAARLEAARAADPDPPPRGAARADPAAGAAPRRGPAATADPAEAAPRRAAAFADPLVEAVARALTGRGHDERRVRAAIRGWPARDGQPAGEAGVRAALVEPMLRAAAERLLGDPRGDPGGDHQQPVAPPSAPAGAQAGDQAPWEAGPWPPREPAKKAPAARPAPGPRRDTADDDLWALADALQGRRG
jgi:hypothetical protein